jgi:rhodanese-related sulfurtransferase
MEWLTWIIIEAAVALFLLLARLTLVRSGKAHELLKEGAVVVDLRSPQEFQEKHIPGAVNIPLDCLRDQKISVAPNKDQTLLLHSLSGTRSGMGKVLLKRLGYPNVFNLGWYGRAERIVAAHNGFEKED